MTRADARSSEAVDRRGTDGRLLAGIGLLVLGLGAATVAVLGPLVAGVIGYHVSEGAVGQVKGGDAAGLVLVAPIAILAGVLVVRRHRAGAIVAMGPTAYALYMYPQLALGGDVARYSGNSERFFPLFLGLFLVAGALALWEWREIDPSRLPSTGGRIDRVLGWLSLLVAAFLVIGLHLPGLVDAYRDRPTGSEYLADPVVFWLVKFMDLGIVVPVLSAVGIGILRRRRWTRAARYGAAGWMALLGSSVAGMAIVMQATGDPAASTAITVAFTVFAVAAIWIALVIHLPLARVFVGDIPVDGSEEQAVTGG